MTTSRRKALVLGGTGRTGALVARKLLARGLEARTASRRGADVTFDWDEPATYAPALNGVDRVYLVTPTMRIKFASQVAGFLDLAAATGVRHVTYLSTYGSDRAPPEVDIRAVELDLARRGNLTHSILRPAWVMQNFSDEHLPLIGGAITVPTGGGAEAFVDAGDMRRSRSRHWSIPRPMPARNTRRPAHNRSRSARSQTSLPASPAGPSPITTSIRTFGSAAQSRPASSPPIMRPCFAG